MRRLCECTVRSTTRAPQPSAFSLSDRLQTRATPRGGALLRCAITLAQRLRVAAHQKTHCLKAGHRASLTPVLRPMLPSPSLNGNVAIPASVLQYQKLSVTCCAVSSCAARGASSVVLLVSPPPHFLSLSPLLNSVVRARRHHHLRRFFLRLLRPS